MATSNLPAVRNTTGLAVRRADPRPQAQAQAVSVPAPLRLSTALLIVSAIAALLAAVSVHAGRDMQAGLVGAVGAVLLFAAGIERWREVNR